MGPLPKTRRVAIIYFDRAGYVLQAVTPIIQSSPILPGQIENEVRAHCPGSALIAEVITHTRGEPLIYDLSRVGSLGA